jgi:photosystem II stability/assembly factor-like uncharacterized protein
MIKNDIFLCTNGDYIYKYTLNVGWSKLINSGIKEWRGIDCDDAGLDIYACAWKDYIYKSTDFGENWTAVATFIGKRSWTAIICDKIAFNIIACATWSENNSKGDYVWISRDSGNTWEIASTQIGINGNGISLWSSVACSDDGNIITAVELYGNVWISKDNGVSWVNSSGQSNIFKLNNFNSVDVCMSTDGQIISVITKPNKLDVGNAYTTKNCGNTWLSFPLNQESNTIASSTNGVFIAIGTNANYIYTSNNTGFSFSQQFGSRINNWSTVTVSPDDNLFIGAAYGGYVYQSSNGSIWTMVLDSPEKQWLDSCISNVNAPIEKRIQDRNIEIQARKARKKPKMIGHKKVL